jgi:hypothetical protein
MAETIARLVKVASKHNALSQDSYDGRYWEPPTQGQVFVFSHRVGRCIRTTPVVTVEKEPQGYYFATLNSVYRLVDEQATT